MMLGEDIFIRPLNWADCEIADQINRLAFEMTESRLSELRRNLEIQPDGWFVTEYRSSPISSELVGMVGVVNYGSSAYIGQLAILPSFQRRGIGRALMGHVLSWLDSRKVPTILLDASEKGYPLYLQLGFTALDQSFVYALDRMPTMTRCPDGVESMRSSDMDELVEFDARIFPGNRKQVFRLLLRDFPDNAFIVRDDTGRISAFLFIQGRKLGPWVAASSEEAERLLMAAFSKRLPGFPFAVVPGMNTDADSLLRGYGFQVYRSNRHMRRGMDPGYQRSKVYGQASFAIG